MVIILSAGGAFLFDRRLLSRNAKSFAERLFTVYGGWFDQANSSDATAAQGTDPLDESYQIVAYLLNMNDIIDDEYELNHKNIGAIKMPNHDGFLMPDPRPDAQPNSGNPCMKDCDVPTKIIGKARDIDVTPENES